MKPLSQSLADADAIVRSIIPPTWRTLVFQDDPSEGDDLSVVPARWPGGIGVETLTGETAWPNAS